MLFTSLGRSVLGETVPSVGEQHIYLKWTFTEYKELLSIGLDRIWQIVHNDVSLMVPFLASVLLKAGYLREQFLVPFYFLFCFILLFFWARLNILIFLPILGWKYSCIILWL